MSKLIQTTYIPKAQVTSPQVQEYINNTIQKLKSVNSIIQDTLFHHGARIEIGLQNVGIIFPALLSTHDGRDWKNVPGCYICKETKLDNTNIAHYGFAYFCPCIDKHLDYGSFDLMLHEFGHCVDNELGEFLKIGKLSNTKEFVDLTIANSNIFNENISYLKTYLSTPLEFFAETFAMFHSHIKIKDISHYTPFYQNASGICHLSDIDKELTPSEYLKMNAPDVYKYFDTLPQRFIKKP